MDQATSTAAVVVSKSRKRRRNHQRTSTGTISAGGTGTPTTTLPRVTTAPANLGRAQPKRATSGTRIASSDRGAAPAAAAKPPVSPPFASSADLDAQISTLNLINTYGYGPVPGTPLLRAKIPPATSGPGRQRCRTRDAPNNNAAATAVVDGIAGGSAVGRGTGTDRNYPARNIRTADTRAERASRAERGPWMGTKAEIERDTLGLVTIERDEYKTLKTRREAAAKGRSLLSQLDRVLSRRDLSTAAQILKSARDGFRAAGDAAGTSEVDAALMKVKADVVMRATEAAREIRDYDLLQQLMFEALYYFSVLARLGRVQRHDTLRASERLEAERKTYESLRYPRRRCREYALEDGRKCRDAAVALSRKRMYAEARSRLEDARRCFDWAGGASLDIRELQRVASDLEVRENAKCGDRLVESVAKKLQFLTSKDYQKLFSELTEAATAYEVAHDREGAQVVRLVTAGLSAVNLAEQLWLELIHALKERRYSAAVRHLRDAKRHIADAKRSLHFVSPSLTRAAKILSPAGALTPLDIVSELATLDGLRDHTKSIRALNQGMLDKAQELNTSAREVFEYIARCKKCGSANRNSSSSGFSSSVGGGGGGAKTSSSSSGIKRGDAGKLVGTNRNAAARLEGQSGTISRTGTALKAQASSTDGAATATTTYTTQATQAPQATQAIAEKNNNRTTFAPSHAQLSEGDALLLKIRRSTTTRTDADGCIVPRKSKGDLGPGVRHRVEDLLDDVSETEDIITRNKALERGDKLMSKFWDTMANADTTTTTPTATATATSTPPTIAIASSTNVAKRDSSDSDGVTTTATGVDPQNTAKGVATDGETIGVDSWKTKEGTAAAAATATPPASDGYDIANNKATLAGTGGNEGGVENLPGIEGGVETLPGLGGGALSSDIAGRCLKLLAEAREAYEGQGFAQQADGAARLRAGIMAERCLAKAPTLARKANNTTTTTTTVVTADAAASAAITAASTPTTAVPVAVAAAAVQETSVAATVDYSWLPWLPWSHSGDDESSYAVGDFEAAQAAAREAEENYTLAGNPEGALRARRTELSLRGDEALVAVAPLLDKRAYDAVLEGLERARRLYADAGPEGSEGLQRTRDPTGLVKGAAMCDGQRLKGEAVCALRCGRIETSTELCEQAQGCFLFADREGLADATADVKAAIHMVKRLASGDAVVLEAEAAALGDAASDRAVELLRKAKSFYHDAQLSYEGLVDQVTSLLEERPDDPGVVRKAMDLQDNINGIYDSRRDGQRAVKVESRLDCLAADASLDNLAQVVDHGQFEGARTLLSSASLVYERSADQARLSKATRIHCLVGLVENAAQALEEGRYSEAEDLIAKCLQKRSVLAVERPLSLRPPCCALFQGGEESGAGAKTAVLLRVRAAGDVDRVTALTLLDEGDFEAAKLAAASASVRFRWWASHGAEEEEEEKEEGQNDRQEVVRQAEELTTRIASAAGKAQAERLTREGRDLKVAGDSAGAVRALSAAAKLFRDVGSLASAAATHAEASRTEAEALLLTCTSLHREGKLDAVAEQLQKAEDLLLEATPQQAQAGSMTTTATSVATTKDQQRDDNNPVDDDAAKGVIGSSSGGDTTSSNSDDVPQAAANGGLLSVQSILDDLHNFRHRVAGDVVMRGVAPALEERQYDLALRLMLEADDQYTRVNEGRWTTSAVAAATAAGKANVGGGGAAASPKELAVKRAAQDGDRLRADAASAILKDKNPAKAQDLLSKAEACMVWAGVDPFAAGAGAVAKDIRVFEARAEGDKKCQGLVNLLLERESERANDMFEETLTKYRQGDAFKQIADMRAIMFCVERESNLCSDVISTVTAQDPVACLKTLEETRPVFKIGADMRSAVLRDVIGLMGTKYRHIVLLSTICRAWVQCINGVSLPSGGETVPDHLPGVALKEAVSDLQALMTSAGAAALDIPFNTIQDACSKVSVKITPSPSPPSEKEEEALLSTGAPEKPTASRTSIPGESPLPLPATVGGKTAGDDGSFAVRPEASDDDQNIGRAGGSNIQGTQGNNAGATDEGATDEMIGGGDIGRPSSKDADDGSTNLSQEKEGSNPALGATTRVFEDDDNADGVGGVANESDGGGHHTDREGSGRPAIVGGGDFQASGGDTSSTVSSFARGGGGGDGTATLVDTAAAANSGDAHANQTTPAATIEFLGGTDARGGSEVGVGQPQSATVMETSVPVEGNNSLVRSPSGAVHRDGLLESGVSSSSSRSKDDAERGRSEEKEEARPEEDDSGSDVSYDLGDDDDFGDEEDPLSSSQAESSAGRDDELSQKINKPLLGNKGTEEESDGEPLRNKGTGKRGDDDGSSNAGTVLGSPPPSPPSSRGVVAAESEALPVGVDKADEDGNDDFICSSNSNSDNASNASSHSDTGGEVMSTSTTKSNSKSVGEISTSSRSSSNSRLSVPDLPENDSDQDATPSLPTQPVPAGSSGTPQPEESPSGTQQPDEPPSGTQQPEEPPSDTQQPEEPPSDTEQPEEPPTTDSASLNDEYSVGSSTSVSAGSGSEEPDSDAVEDSLRDDQGTPHALGDTTGGATTLVSEVETTTAAAPSSHVTESGGGPEEPPNEEEDEEDDDVATGTDQKNDDNSSGTHLSTTHAYSSDITIGPPTTITESSTTTTRQTELQHATSPSAEEPHGSRVADERSSSDKGDNGDGKLDVLKVKHQEDVDPEACTTGYDDDDQVILGGKERDPGKEGSVAAAGAVSDEGSAKPLAAHATEPDAEGVPALPPTHDAEPDAARPVAEDAYKPDFEGIDTKVDVGDLKARFSKVLAGAASDEGSAPPPTHATEPDTVGPVAEDAYIPDCEGIDTKVDVDDLRERSSNIVDTGAVAEGVPALPPTHDAEPDTAGPVAEDAYKPDLEEIDTKVDVGDLQARFSNVLAGAVGDEGSTLPLTHDTDPDTVGPAAEEDAYKPDFEAINTAVDVDDLQARFSQMLGSYSGVPEYILEAAPLSAQEFAVPPPADQSVASPEAPDTVTMENEEESVPQSQPWAANPEECAVIDPDTPPLENEEGLNPQPQQPSTSNSGEGADSAYPEVEENGQERLAGFYSSSSPESLGTTDSDAAVERIEDGGAAAASTEEEQNIVDEGEKDPASSPVVSGACGDSARDGVSSSGTPHDATQHPHQQQDVIAHDPSSTGDSPTAQRQEAGVSYNGVVVEDVDGANGSSSADDRGLLVGVLLSETTDYGTKHHQQEQEEVIVHDPPHTGLVGALSSSDDVTAHDPSHTTGGLETAQEAGVSGNGVDVEGAGGAAESGLVGAPSSEAPDEGTPQHHQQGGVVAQDDPSDTGGLEAAQQQSGVSYSGDDAVEGADGFSAESGPEALNTAAKSSAGSLPGEDGVRENVAEQRLQQEESDELYDIDDLEMSSSEDN